MILDLKGDERFRIEGEPELWEIVFEYSEAHGRPIPKLQESGYMKSDIKPEVVEAAV